MNSNKSITRIAAVILIVAASFVFGGELARRTYERRPEKPDTVIVTRWLHDSIPVTKDSIVYRTKIVYLPVHDTTEVHDTTAVRDSVLVEVPIIEKTYAGDNYKAVVRGYNPELVDIWVRRTDSVVTLPYRERWSFTVGPQFGYGFTPQGWQPYAGAGITFGYSF